LRSYDQDHHDEDQGGKVHETGLSDDEAHDGMGEADEEAGQDGPLDVAQSPRTATRMAVVM
jgi:hypothetical protein